VARLTIIVIGKDYDTAFSVGITSGGSGDCPAGDDVKRFMILYVGDESSWFNGGTNFSCGTDTWYHVAVTFDDAADTVQLYVNGVLDDEKVNTGTITPNDYPLGIGLDGFQGDDFTGSIDNVRIYNRVLSGSEVMEIFNLTEVPDEGNKVDDDGDGYTENQGDCNDTNVSIHPGAADICGDGVDQNCDGKDKGCLDAPSPPTGVSASDGTITGKVQVSWTASEGAADYDVYRADMPAWTGTAPVRMAVSVIGSSYDDTTAVSGNRYYYWVKARNAGGVSKYSNFDAGYWGMQGSLPAVPGNVSATDGSSSGKVDITWNATDNTLVYEIWRADIPAFLGGNIKKIGTSATTSYSDSTAVNGNRYYYWVKARNSWGVSRYSAFDTGYVGAAASKLSAPENVTASDGSVSGKVQVVWDATTGTVLYEVWRATKLVSEGGKPARIGFLPGTSFDDTSATIGTTYYYWVKSRDSWGASRYSVPDTGYHN